ncbi:hypothetical protein NR798_21650 [Archangium gephyra]|uniref:hypothetical protein n=1 Tax=Archangium gephyra TaxID=48 RepID=UPI0035D4376E
MGFNLFGYLLKGPGPVVPALEAASGRSVREEKKVPFEEATLSKHDPHHFDVLQTEKGFLILCDFDAVNEGMAARLSEGREALTFRMSETSMTFMFEKYGDGKLVWEDGISLEEKPTRMGSVLPIDEDTDIVFHLFPELTKEFTGVDFHGVDLSEPVTRYRLGPAVARNQPAGKPAGPVTRQGDFRQEAEELYLSFWNETAKGKNEKPGRIRQEGAQTVYSFEAYLRAKGVGQEQIRRYCEYAVSDEFREVMSQKMQGLRSGGRKGVAVFTSILWLGLMVIYFIVGLVVSAFTGTSVWSLSFWGWVTAAAVMTCAFLMIRAIQRGKKNPMLIQIFEDEGKRL